MARYVVWYEEHLRDGYDHGARVVPTLEAAQRMIDDLAKFPGNVTFRLFELGEEIPITVETVEEPQPPKATRRCKVVQ